MKTITTLILIILTCFSLTSMSQDTSTPSSFMSFNLGASIPIGVYKNDNYANTGYMIKGLWGFSIKHSNFGLATQVNYFGNKFNIENFVSDLATEPTFSYYGESNGNYSGQSVLAGLYTTLPFKGGSFDTRITAGLMAITIPAVSVGVDDNAGTIAAVGFDKAKGVGFTYGAGFDLRINIGKNWSLIGAFDYQAAKPSIEITINQLAIDENDNIYTLSETIKDKWAVNFVSTTVGIAYEF